VFFAERCISIVEGYKKPLRRIRKVKVHGLLVNIARLIRSWPLARLCYDTQSVEVVLFPVATPEKTPWALSSDLYQEKLPYKPLAERFRRNICLLYSKTTP
jgi:hypothetical protein